MPNAGDNFERINSFLHYIYLPFYQPERAALLFPGVDVENDIPVQSIIEMHEREVIKYGIQLLKSTFSKIIESTSTQNHIVPLSGGYDSRAIIATLIDAGLKDQILAVTFGVPGTMDFELGTGLAHKFGIKHRQINLNHVEVSTEKLLETALAGCSWTFLIDGFYNSLIPKEFGDNALYWSGYMGDTLAGGVRARLSIEHNSYWGDARKRYAKIIGILHSTIGMPSPDYDPVKSLPGDPIFANSPIPYIDQLYFFIHNVNYIKSVVIPEGFDYLLPFCSPGWVKFMLSLSLPQRIDKNVYKKILLTAYPEYYKYPVTYLRGAALPSSWLGKKYRYGLFKASEIIAASSRIWNHIGVYKRFNYLDYDASVRDRIDFQKMVKENIYDLKARQIIDWLDPERMWLDHIDDKADYGFTLLLLTALEISFKSEEILSR